MSPSTVNIHLPVLHAMQGIFKTYPEAIAARGANAPAGADALSAGFHQLLERQAGFLEKVKELDQLFDQNMAFHELREYAFDLLMVNFLAAESLLMDDDYLDSQEWLQIEDATIDRGSELLNILLYINEAMEEEVEISVDDFLREFLLVDDDQFQSEYHIYEDLIQNQALVDADLPEMIKSWKSISPESELKDLLIPLLLFFSEPAKSAELAIQDILHHKEIPALQVALLQGIYAFKNGFRTILNINHN